MQTLANPLSDFLTSPDAPWWNSLVAVALGALLAYIASKIGDSRKAKQEDRRQWDRDIRQLASEALADCDTLSRLEYQRVLHPDGDWVEYVPGPIDASSIIAGLNRVSENLGILAAENSERELKKMRDAADTLAMLKVYEETMDPYEIEAAGYYKSRLNRNYQATRGSFIKAVRKDIRLDR